MEKNMNIINCPECKKDRQLTNASWYEAKRLNRLTCKSCSLKNKVPRGSKYDKFVKTGDIFGMWTVVGDRVTESGSEILCRCECGIEKLVRVTKLLNKKSLGCITCRRKGKTSSNWKGVGEIPRSAFTKVKLSAKNRKKEFKLTHDYLHKLFEEQKHKCALSGIELFFLEESKNLSQSNGNASLDRIDNTKGYIEGNVQWVHKDINFMKQTYTNEYFKELCRLVTTNDKN